MPLPYPGGPTSTPPERFAGATDGYRKGMTTPGDPYPPGPGPFPEPPGPPDRPGPNPAPPIPDPPEPVPGGPVPS